MWRFVIIAITLFPSHNVLCRPSDQPTKFVLGQPNVTNEEPGFVLSMLQHGEDVVSEGRNNIASILFARQNENSTKTRSLEPKILPSASVPRESVRLENESQQAFFEVKRKEPVHSVLQNILKPTPIVDNIQEHEKYGNDGDRFMTIGRALVNGFEGLSNFLNSALDLPVNAAKKASRGLTEALNKIGSRLVGLE